MKSSLKFLSFLFCFLILGHKISFAQCGLDIFIANDQSGSVDDVENAQSRHFIAEFIRNFSPLGTTNDKTRVAIAEWDRQGSWNQYDFPGAGKNYTTDLGDVISFQNSPRTLSGFTDPYDALLKTYNALHQTPIAGRNTNKVIVLMTDAACNQIQNNIVQLAKQIKDEGIYIIVMAIDAASSCPALQGSNIASPLGYFNAVTYAQLQEQTISYAKNIIEQSCNFPPPPPPSFDLAIQLNSFTGTNCQPDGSGGNYTTNYTIKNSGLLAFNNTLKVAFYNANPIFPSSNLLAVQTINSINIAPNATYTGSFTNSNFNTAGRVYAVVNFEGTLSPPLPSYLDNLLYITPEQRAYNNFSDGVNIITDATCKPKANIKTSVNHTGIACDSTITYNVELCNIGNASTLIDSIKIVAASQFILKNSNAITGDSTIQRVWGTYFGGGLNDDAFSVVSDAEGNVYISGNTESIDNISSIGSFQAFRSGPNDAFLAKFDGQGSLIWSTYFGSTGIEEVASMALDNEGNVYIVGKTSSTSNLATTGAHQTTYGANPTDAFVAKFSKNGIREWTTYYGGAAEDYGTSIAVDKNGFIYFAGFTTSPTSPNRIATTFAHQTMFHGETDGFIVKLDNNGTRIWGTYYGGNNKDKISSLALDEQSNIYVAGETNSNTYISTTTAHQYAHGGGTTDAFLSKFDSNGVKLWGTYYGGTLAEMTRALVVDNVGDVYLAGYTNSSNRISTVGSHQVNYQGGRDAFLVKFNPNGVRLWGTYYGGTNSDEAHGLCVDLQNNVYLVGQTVSTNNIATEGVYQSTYGGTVDAFIVKFKENGTRQWGTYYGGSSWEASRSISINSEGFLHIAGYTNSTNGIATNGVHQTTHGDGAIYNDAFLAKFSTDRIGFEIPPNSCKNFQFTYSIDNTAPGTYNFSVGFNASNINPTTDANPVILPDNNFNAGTYTNLNGFNGANHTTDDVVIPAILPAACASGDKVSTAVSISYNNTCGNNFAQATVTINNTSGVDILNTVLELNLTGIGASFAGEMYNVSSNLSYQVPFVLHTDYPNIPNALYTKTGKTRIPLWKLPVGTTTFNIDISLGSPTTNLSVKIDSINSNYNASGQSNTAALSQAVTVPANATISGFSCPASISAGNNITFSGISTTNSSSIKWASSTVANITNTGTITNPAIVYTPTPKDIANGFVAISLTALNSNGCETTRSCQININSVVYDYGDAPITYDLNKNIQPYAGSATLLSGLYLGITTPGTENTAKSSANATGDGNEEDGLVNPSCGTKPVNLQPFPLTVKATNNSNITAYISAFIDWNNDGDYLDDGEAVLNIIQANSNSGTKDYTLQFRPETANTTLDKYFVRLRISTDSNSVKQPYGTAPQGEVEDHVMELGAASTFNNPQSICQGSSYSINGKNYTVAGTYRDTLKNAAVGGCDSIVVTNLTINTSSTFNNPQSICQGSSYSINGKNYTTAGVYRDTLKNAAVGGCDSIIITNLTITTSSTYNNNQSICPGNSYSINGKNYTVAGTYRDTLKNAATGGCDSIVITNLTIKTASTFNNPQSICQGSSYSINGKNYTTAGVYRDTLKNAAVGGCDSIIVTNLTIETSSTFNNPQSICQGSSYSINGKNYTVAGTYRDTLKNAAVGGCDSIVVTNLTINTSLTYNNNQSICQGSSYSINGKNYTVAGIYRDTLKNAATGGCDSIVVTNLTVNTSLTFNNPQSICQGSSYSINGKNYTVAGTYRDTLKNAAVGGCDSIIITNLTITTASTFNNPQSICQGSSYSINGKNYTVAGTYRDTLKNAAVGGCDSIIVTNLTVNTSLTYNNNQSICQGSSYSINGKNYTTAGIYRDTLKNAAVGGCDSILVTNLTITTSSTYNNNQSICPGSSYSINGKNYTVAGTYRDTLKNTTIGGCDSIIVTNLTVNTSPTFNNPQSICQGSSYSINGKNYTVAGVYRDTLKNAAVGGCDSIIVTHLTVVNQIETNLNEIICSGSTFTVGTQTFTTSGNYVVNLKAAGGCDSIVTLNLTVVNQIETNLNETICSGSTFIVGTQTFTTSGNYVVNLKAAGGCDSIVTLDLAVVHQIETNLNETICTGSTFIVGTQTFTTTGVYEVILQSDNGCDSIIQLSLSVTDEVRQSQERDTTVCIQDELILEAPEGFKEYQWQDGRMSSSYLVTSPGWYWVEMQDECMLRTDSIYVAMEDCGCEVFFPQAFSPNRDGVNDYFRPIEKNIVQVSLTIYNRWGEQVFESAQGKAQWDGISNGIAMPMDTYVYHYYGMCTDGSYKTYSGHVTIVR